MVPSLGAKLSDEPGLFDEVWAWGSRVLGLEADRWHAPHAASGIAPVTCVDRIAGVA